MSDPTNGEFTEIMEHPGDGSRPVMSRPPTHQASKKFILDVRDALELDDDQALKASDWIIDKMERFGAYYARPVFLMDGTGPCCSWCGTIWPLCGHHHQSGNLDGEGDES